MHSATARLAGVCSPALTGGHRAASVRKTKCSVKLDYSQLYQVVSIGAKCLKVKIEVRLSCLSCFLAQSCNTSPSVLCGQGGG